MHSYTVRDVAGLLGLSRSVILRLVAAGFVTPGRGPRREYRFSFPDLVLLRAAQGLQAARIPSRRIVQSLRRLRESLPEQMPLAGLRIAAVGNEVVVRDGGTPWSADSGQMLFDFELTPESGAVSALAGQRPAPPPASPFATPASDAAAPGSAVASARRRIATDWFQQGVELEDHDRTKAEAAYRKAIAAEPARADAYLNLGVLLGATGRHAEAAALYRQGLRRCPGEPLLHFNLAVALEDLHQFDAAIVAYERCLVIEPGMADAHFNAARLHDQRGHAKQAIRHYSAYRRLRSAK